MDASNATQISAVDHSSQHQLKVDVTGSLTARPLSLPISPSPSLSSLAEPDFSTDEVDYGDSEERPMISHLMTKYAANDKHYCGIDVVAPSKTSAACGRPPVDAGPPRPVLYVQHDGTPTKGTMESYWQMACSDVSKDGPVGSKPKKKPAVMALRINKGERELSLYGNGKLVDRVVASPSSNSSHVCYFIYHHNSSNDHVLCLNPDQSPKVQSPPAKRYGQVISYYDPGANASTPPTPGAEVVKVESKTHVYLALDYTDENNAKLIAMEEVVFEEMLMQLTDGKSSDRKIKPIVSVRHDMTVKGANDNNTAFYFKTDKNYYFVKVMADLVHLGVEKVAIGDHNDDTYKRYLTFKPHELDKCPPSDPPSGVKKSVVADVEAVDGESGNTISSPQSSESSHTYSPSTEGLTGVGVAMASAGDSGVESEAREDDTALTMPQV